MGVLKMADLDLIILGILNGTPLHGYMIKQTIESSYGNRYFKLSNSALYPRLAKLERDGYIEGKKEPQEAVPDRKVYHLTDAGKRRLKELAATPIKPGSVPGANDFDYKVHAVHFGLINKEERRLVTSPLYEDAVAELKEALQKREKFCKHMDKYSLTVLDSGIEELQNKVRFYGIMMEMD